MPEPDPPDRSAANDEEFAEFERRLAAMLRPAVGVGSALVLVAWVGLPWGTLDGRTYSAEEFLAGSEVFYAAGLGAIVALYGVFRRRAFTQFFAFAASLPAIGVVASLLFADPVTLGGESVGRSWGFWVALVLSIATALAALELEAPPEFSPAQ